jgi:hypothetical protein
MIVFNRRLMMAIPPLLVATMYGAFHYLTAWLGFPAGYLASFAVYWIFWCVVLPTSILGWRTFLSLFRTSPTPFTKRIVSDALMSLDHLR